MSSVYINGVAIEVDNLKSILSDSPVSGVVALDTETSLPACL